jgi:selenium metabolism protein YedF
MKIVDARGQACPVPLIMTKKALNGLPEGEAIEILIDNETSAKNVSRFLEEHNMKPVSEMEGTTIRLRVGTSAHIPAQSRAEDFCETPATAATDYVIAFQKNALGQGDEDLGQLLIKGFINTLPETDHKPSALVFLNSGIFLALRDSAVLESLSKLEKSGIKILVCGTCLDYFQKKEELAAGVVSNMYDIINLLSKAGKVLYP